MEDENPYAAPQVELDELDPALKDDPRIRRKEKILLVPIDAPIPRRCVSCNRRAPHPLKVTIVKPDPSPKRDYRWYAVAAAAIAFLYLAAACAGLDLPLELPVHAPLWLFPFLVGGSFVALYLAKWRMNSAMVFYACRGHHRVAVFSRMLGWVITAIGVGFPTYMSIPGMDVTWLSDLRGRYLVSIFGFFFVVSWIPVWCRVNVWGKQLDANTIQFQGFGQKYLESFPESDDA